MIPKLTDLVEMMQALDEHYEKEDFSNVVIEFTVDEKTLKKVNEEMFYRNRGNGVIHGTPPTSDEVVVNIGKYCFRYVAEKSEEK